MFSMPIQQKLYSLIIYMQILYIVCNYLISKESIRYVHLGETDAPAPKLMHLH